MDADSDKLNDLSRRVIGSAFTVLNALGAGFVEKVYENALAHELCAAGLAVVQQCGRQVHYKGVVVGEYSADLLVEGVLLVELKTLGLALRGYTSAVPLLVGSGYLDWVFVAFPCRVLLLSSYVLAKNLRRAPFPATAGRGRQALVQPLLSATDFS